MKKILNTILVFATFTIIFVLLVLSIYFFLKVPAISPEWLIKESSVIDMDKYFMLQYIHFKLMWIYLLLWSIFYLLYVISLWVFDIAKTNRKILDQSKSKELNETI